MELPLRLREGLLVDWWRSGRLRLRGQGRDCLLEGSSELQALRRARQELADGPQDRRRVGRRQGSLSPEERRRAARAACARRMDQDMLHHNDDAHGFCGQRKPNCCMTGRRGMGETAACFRHDPNMNDNRSTHALRSFHDEYFPSGQYEQHEIDPKDS